MLYRWLFSLIPFALISGLQAQTSVLTCLPSAVPTLVRAEGIAERTGDVIISCSGGLAAAQVSGNIIVSLNVNVTNRILGDGSADVSLNVDNGSGVTTFTARPFAINAVAFNGVVFNASSQGRADLRIVNLRGNASQIATAGNTAITASVSFTGAGLAVPSSTFLVANPQRGLLANSSGRLVCDQNGSPLPDSLTVTNLLSTSAYTSMRFTEGFASAFAPLGDSSNFRADSGVRIIARYSGFPPAARLFVPDAIAGSDADRPTSGGDFGLSASGGQYTPGRGQLLLVRVNGADANGAGGAPALPVPGVTTSFNSASEIRLSGGSGYAVFEVVDANAFVVESAQFPTFLGLAPNSVSGAIQTNSGVNLAPLSTVFSQSSSAPIPRFLDTPPPSDCSALNDCGAGYFPTLSLDTTPLELAAAAGEPVTRYVPIHNNGAGVLRWSATATYGTGASNWLRLMPAQGVNDSTLRLDAITTGLQPGTYQATVSVDAGPLVGVKTISVRLTVTAGVPVVVAPAITGVTNAAAVDQTELVAGSLATIMGSHFSGRTLQVTFDGTPASILYSSDQQINLQVPAAVAGKQTSNLVVTVDGNAGPATVVHLATAAPAIFPGAVLNQDYGVNGASLAARTGSVVQIFATGLPASGIITARIHDRDVPVPSYGGPAPGLPGVQQVNVLVPADLPTMQSYIFVCGGPSANQQVCSAPAKIWIQR
jgi:uncharacterized protein (TIGR03437 family)